MLFLLEISAFALTEVDHERSNYPLTRGKAVPNSVLWSISDTLSEPFVTLVMHLVPVIEVEVLSQVVCQGQG